MPLLAAVATRAAVDGQRAVAAPQRRRRADDRCRSRVRRATAASPASTPRVRRDGDDDADAGAARVRGFARRGAALAARADHLRRRPYRRARRRAAALATMPIMPATSPPPGATCCRSSARWAQGDAGRGAAHRPRRTCAAKRSGWSSRSPSQRGIAIDDRAASTRRCRADGEARARRPDPRQHPRQCGAPFARRRQRRGHRSIGGRGECRVTIADQGPGIAPADQQRIFERYERVGDRARRQRPRPRHLAPPGALDGRRHHSWKARPARARASPWSCPRPSARRPAHNRAAVAPT